MGPLSERLISSVLKLTRSLPPSRIYSNWTLSKLTELVSGMLIPCERPWTALQLWPETILVGKAPPMQ